jgi:hypothetical protein
LKLGLVICRLPADADGAVISRIAIAA